MFKKAQKILERVFHISENEYKKKRKIVEDDVMKKL